MRPGFAVWLHGAEEGWTSGPGAGEHSPLTQRVRSAIHWSLSSPSSNNFCPHYFINLNLQLYIDIEISGSGIELETKAIGRFAKVSIVSYNRPSLMIIVSASQFHVYLPWGQCPFSIVS